MESIFLNILKRDNSNSASTAGEFRGDKGADALIYIIVGIIGLGVLLVTIFSCLVFFNVRDGGEKTKNKGKAAAMAYSTMTATSHSRNRDSHEDDRWSSKWWQNKTRPPGTDLEAAMSTIPQGEIQ